MIKFILSSKTILPLFDSHRCARNNSTTASLAHEDARACARKHTYSSRLVHGGQIFHVNCNGLCPMKGAFGLCPPNLFSISSFTGHRGPQSVHKLGAHWFSPDNGCYWSGGVLRTGVCQGGERSYGSIKAVAPGTRGQGHHRSPHRNADGQKTKPPHGSLVNKVGAEGQRLGGGWRTHVDRGRKEGRMKRRNRSLYDQREELKGGSSVQGGEIE